MRKRTALYYPNVEPPLGWLRSTALVFDHVTSFVPPDSDDELSDELKRFADKTDAWQPYRPDQNTSDLVGPSVERLNAAFAELAEQRQVPTDMYLIPPVVTDAQGRSRFKDFAFIHGTKLSAHVRDVLIQHRLLLPRAITEPFKPGDWWLIDEQACHLLLAHIADNLAATQDGWASVTDNQDCYLFTAVDAGMSNTREARRQLAHVIISDLIPDSIDQLSLESYVDLRLRYEPLRAEVSRFVREVIQEDELSDISDPVQLRQAATDAVRSLRTEVEKFRDSAVGNAVRAWAPFTIGGVLTLLGAALPAGLSFSVPMTTAKLTISGIEKSGKLNQPATKRVDLLRLMAGVRSEILAGA